MPDREKVIGGLREMSSRATWEDIDRIRHKFQPIINEAIILLREQEADRKFYAEKCDELYSVAKARVEVVRCKDCVFRDNRDGMCEHVQQVRDPDWYCADGERAKDSHD